MHFPVVGETGTLLRLLARAILRVIDKSSRASSCAGPRLGGGVTGVLMMAVGISLREGESRSFLKASTSKILIILRVLFRGYSVVV